MSYENYRYRNYENDDPRAFMSNYGNNFADESRRYSSDDDSRRYCRFHDNDNDPDRDCKCHRNDNYPGRDWKCRRYDNDNDPDRDYKCYNNMQRSHVHEYAGIVKLAEECEERHTHRVAGVTGEAIPINNGTNHVHKINENTDYYDHSHKICGTTGPAIPIRGTNKHIHLVYGVTTRNDGHCHNFLFNTQIQAPLI